MTLLAIGRCIGKSKNWNQHEPTITEIMSDSITVAMMEADGVDQSHSKRSYVASRKTTVIWRRTKSAFAVQNVAFDDPVLQYLKQRADIGTAASRTSCSVEMLRCFADSGPSGLEGDEVARHPRHRTTRPFVARRGANVRGPAPSALTTEKIRDAFARAGAEPVGGTPAEFGGLIRSQAVYWGKVVKDSGIKMQQ